jgi:hypothetical protein
MFDKMIPGMLNPEMIQDTARIVNEAIKDRIHVNLIVNNRFNSRQLIRRHST